MLRAAYGWPLNGWGVAHWIWAALGRLASRGLALLGAVIGAVFAWGAFAGHLQSFGGIAIRLGVTPGMAVGGILFAIFLAFVGGIFPAVKAARQPIATAIRAT